MMEGSVSDESGERADVDHSIREDEEEEKYLRRREETPSLRRDFWITASLKKDISILKNKIIKSHDILSNCQCIGPAQTRITVIIMILNWIPGDSDWF